MCANFYSYFKSKPLMNMFKRLCKKNQTGKFHRLWRELDENTRGHLEEKSKKNHQRKTRVLRRDCLLLENLTLRL